MAIQKKSSIMVAEDDPDDRFLLQSAIQTIIPNSDLRFVKDGEELLANLEQTAKNISHPRPDVIILDLNMPRINGHQALMRIKKKEIFDSIAIAVLTTSGEKKDKEFCQMHGVACFYTKPDNFNDLIDIVKSIRSTLNL